MQRLQFLLTLLALSFTAGLVGACSPTVNQPSPGSNWQHTLTTCGDSENVGKLTTRCPQAADYRFMAKGLIVFPLPPASEDAGRLRGAFDFRHNDLSILDLHQHGKVLLDYASFDSKTRWPGQSKMPKNFDPVLVMELGKNPGLGVRELHRRGITGRGIGIGIVDQPLLREHVEYTDRLRHHEEVQSAGIALEPDASMHGCAVTSIAAGKTVGVAPEADIYYISASALKVTESGVPIRERDFRSYACAVRRLVEINDSLSTDRRIRVISISIGWSSEETGYDDMVEAVREAESHGILVVSSSMRDYLGLRFQGLGRFPLANPDTPKSYEPGRFWISGFRKRGGQHSSERILVPMDSRTTAAPNGSSDYVFYRRGGWSWSIPYIAGLYALAAQVRPEVTPKEFWQLATQTGTTIDWKDDTGHVFQLGPIVNPVRLIEELHRGN